MRNLGALGAVAIASLVSHGVLGRPVPQVRELPYSLPQVIADCAPSEPYTHTPYTDRTT